LERRVGLDARHVIVDQPEWRLVRSWLAKQPVSADGIHLAPGNLAFLPRKEGNVLAVWVEMVGPESVQVRYGSREGDPWTESASSLYGHLDNAKRKAKDFKDAWEAAREASFALMDLK
jgi:hypothetical protein